MARGQLERRHDEPGGVGVEVQVEEVDIHLADVRGAERVRGTDKTGYGGRGRRDLRTAVLGHSPQAGQHAGPHPDSRHRTYTQPVSQTPSPERGFTECQECLRCHGHNNWRPFCPDRAELSSSSIDSPVDPTV